MAQTGFVQELQWAYSAVPSSGPEIVDYPEAAAQAFKKGDPVYLNTSGQVLLAVDTAGFHGIALEDASGTTNNVVRVLVVNVTDRFRASQCNAGAAQASAQTQVGLRCSYIKSTVTGQTDKTALDTADVANKNWEIVDLLDAAATTNGEVIARVVPAKLISRGS